MSEDLDSNGYGLTPALTSVIKPTAEYLGNEIKDQIESKISAIKRKRQEANLISHIQKVTGTDSDSEEVVTGNRQLDLFQIWMAGAQDVSQEEKSLSLMWEGLLEKILKGINLEERLIEVLSNLSETDAALLLKFARNSHYKPCNDHEIFLLGQPQFFEIVQESKFRRNLFNVIAGIFVAWIFIDIYQVFSEFTSFAESNNIYVVLGEVTTRMLSNIAVTSLIGLIAYFAIRKLTASYQLTWLGSELVRHAKLSDREAEIIENCA